MGFFFAHYKHTVVSAAIAEVLLLSAGLFWPRTRSLRDSFARAVCRCAIPSYSQLAIAWQCAVARFDAEDLCVCVCVCVCARARVCVRVSVCDGLW